VGHKIKGKISYYRGHTAELAAEQAYQRLGAQILAKRWRGAGGKIDLIAQLGGTIIFAEVKAAQTHDMAAHRISARQAQRIYASAQTYLALQPDQHLRFDAVLVDQSDVVDIRADALAYLLMLQMPIDNLGQTGHLRIKQCFGEFDENSFPNGSDRIGQHQRGQHLSHRRRGAGAWA